MSDEESDAAGFREVRIAGVDSVASQHVRDDLWDIYLRVEGSTAQAWRGLFDEEFENGPDPTLCQVRHADRHIVIECVPASETEVYLERIEAIAARTNERYRTEVVPHVQKLGTNGDSSSTADQRRRLRSLDPFGETT